MRIGSVVIPGPAVKENGGCSDCSGHGLLAYGSGSSVVVVDARSMQLLIVLPMPSPRPTSLLPAPFVTCVRWVPEGLAYQPMQEFPSAQLQLAAADRQGRIAVWDVGSGQPITWMGETEKSRMGIQDLCWILGHPWLLAAIHGPSTVVIWDPNTRMSLWRYDAGSEILGSIKCNQLDLQQACVVGLKGLLLSIYVGGPSENDIQVKQHQIGSLDDRHAAINVGTTSGERERGGRDSQFGPLHSSTGTPALASTPGIFARCMFSSGTRGLLYVMLSREIVVFDWQYGMTLSSAGLPRGCGRLLDIVAVVDGELLYCVHVDGKFSVWRRKENSQVFVIVHVDTLMPSAGTTVPAPSVLGVTICSLGLQSSQDITHFDEPPNQTLEMHRQTTFISLSDDGKLWKWVVKNENLVTDGVSLERTSAHLELAESIENGSDTAKLATSPQSIFQLELTGQLLSLPATLTTLAVAVPSFQATVSGGGNGPAVPVPLVVVATQAGSIEIVDPAAIAVTSSFSVHNNNVVRGVRWLGNSRLVSFSFREVKGKGGGYVNRLVVTCVRSGQSKCFRVLQKPERAPVRALRTSPSGRYMLILFREAPAEVWAMTRNPQMLRSLALPFTVMEWALPPAPRLESAKGSLSHRASLVYRERPTIASTVAAANASSSSGFSNEGDTQQDETAESFAFALVNGSLGVFELRGRRVRDFKPKWPVSSFVSTDALVTAMAYRMPHVVMGDRVGNLRWWDVTSGASSSFNTHRGGVRRIKFAPVLADDPSRGRVAVLFNDNTFAIFDLDTQDPIANAITQPQLAGILVLELDWFPLRSNKQDPLLLCIAGADSSFRLLEVQANVRVSKSNLVQQQLVQLPRQRPTPVYCPALLPNPLTLALKMLLQLGVQPLWFDATKHVQGDLRHYLLPSSLPIIGDPVVAEVLLKALEPYRKAGRLLDDESVSAYGILCKKGVAARSAFAAAYTGDHCEASFWCQLPKALTLLSFGSAGPGAFWDNSIDSDSQTQSKKTYTYDDDIDSRGDIHSDNTQSTAKQPMWPFEAIPSDKAAVCYASRERIAWHKKLAGDEASQKQIHELVAIGEFEAAVTLLLATPPESNHFYLDALRAVTLAAAVSPAMHELAVKVVAANMVASDDSLCGTQLLCAVGRYQEACSQLQDAGRWVDACTLAAAHLQGSEHARVLERWGEHVIQSEQNIWKAMILFVAAGELSEALATLRNSQRPDAAALFLLACHEAKQNIMASSSSTSTSTSASSSMPTSTSSREIDLPGNVGRQIQIVKSVSEMYGQYQRRLAHLCSGITLPDNTDDNNHMY